MAEAIPDILRAVPVGPGEEDEAFCSIITERTTLANRLFALDLLGGSLAVSSFSFSFSVDEMTTSGEGSVIVGDIERGDSVRNVTLASDILW